MIVGVLRGLTLSGGEWVIYLLLLCSILAVAVMIERWIVLNREEQGLLRLRDKVQPLLADGEFGNLAKEITRIPGVVSRVLLAGVSQAQAGYASVEEYLTAAGVTERRGVEQRLLILGTLGNNAPFIGLFGTVLGVIKAFHDLSEASGEGPEVVMRGLSEALVATAVGLFVAIPSVIAYNYFQNRIKDLMAGSESLNRLLLARIKHKAKA